MNQEEKRDYESFRYWWLNHRKEDPRTAITKGLARNIAILVYDEIASPTDNNDFKKDLTCYTKCIQNVGEKCNAYMHWKGCFAKSFQKS